MDESQEATDMALAPVPPPETDVEEVLCDLIFFPTGNPDYKAHRPLSDKSV